jgi:hypothetical protein
MRSVLFDTRIMRKLGAVAMADGLAANAIDGDPNTFWLAGGRGARYPHELTISFPAPVAMSGIVCMPRQNSRQHEGDVRQYLVQVSDDGQHWREVLRGELASTWNPQQVRFPQSVTARHLKFTALSGFGNDASTALAELAVTYAGPKLADNWPGTIEYQRVRSATPDVDEGTGVSVVPTSAPPRRNQ